MKPDSPQGLSRLFAEQQAPLSRYFLKRTAHAWDAQDLVQEVYARLLAADHAAIRNPEAYLYTVAANLLRQRAADRRLVATCGDGLEELLERMAVPCEAASGIDRERRRRRLGEIIARLAPKCRAALVLHYRDELGYREIGERLGVSAHMVKKYIVKGLAACRQGMRHYV